MGFKDFAQQEFEKSAVDGPFLTGLAATYGIHAVYQACQDTLGYPAWLVTGHKEAAQVSAALNETIPN